MCVENLRTWIVFLRQSIWGVTYIDLLEKINVFPSISLEITRNMCWKHQNRDHFSETIDLRAHIHMFTWKMNVFPSICLWAMPINVYIEMLRTGHIFPRWLIGGVTCLALLEKWMFSHLSPEKCQKCVLEPSEQSSFFGDDRFEVSHA